VHEPLQPVTTLIGATTSNSRRRRRSFGDRGRRRVAPIVSTSVGAGRSIKIAGGKGRGVSSNQRTASWRVVDGGW